MPIGNITHCLSIINQYRPVSPVMERPYQQLFLFRNNSKCLTPFPAIFIASRYRIVVFFFRNERKMAIKSLTLPSNMPCNDAVSGRFSERLSPFEKDNIQINRRLRTTVTVTDVFKLLFFENLSSGFSLALGNFSRLRQIYLS